MRCSLLQQQTGFTTRSSPGVQMSYNIKVGFSFFLQSRQGFGLVATRRPGTHYPARLNVFGNLHPGAKSVQSERGEPSTGALFRAGCSMVATIRWPPGSTIESF